MEKFEKEFDELTDFFWEHAENHLDAIREQLVGYGIEMSEVGTVHEYEGLSWITDNQEKEVKVVIELIDGGIIPRKYFSVGNIPKGQQETVGVNINFRVHTPLEENDGMLYDVIPYNWTPSRWLPITDREAIVERLNRIFEQFTIDEITKEIKEAVENV
jgi:hypothetical protein